jgi:hypothetical protein
MLNGNFYYIIKCYFKLNFQKIKILASSQSTKSVVFDIFGGVYSQVTLTLNFRRRTLFFTFNFVLPCLILTVCALMGFVLSSDRGEKVGIILFHFILIYFFSF